MENDENVLNTLRSIGFSKSEAKVYLDLVKHTSSSPLNIAKRTKLHRPNVYDSLRSLKQKGFVIEIPPQNGNKTLFKAQDPKNIKHYLKQKEEELDKAIEYLGTIPKNLSVEETVTIKQGRLALREAFFSGLDIGKPILVFGVPPEPAAELTRTIGSEYHPERIRRGIPLKIILSRRAPEVMKKLNSIPLVEARHTNYTTDSVLATSIIGDMVRLITYKNPPTIITLKNKDMAEAYKAHFQSAWDNASTG